MSTLDARLEAEYQNTVEAQAWLVAEMATIRAQERTKRIWALAFILASLAFAACVVLADPCVI